VSAAELDHRLARAGATPRRPYGSVSPSGAPEPAPAVRVLLVEDDAADVVLVREALRDVAGVTCSVEWVATLAAARKHGVRWYIVEDETPTVWQGIRTTLAYLRTVRY